MIPRSDNGEVVTHGVEGRICTHPRCGNGIGHLAPQARYCRDIACQRRRGAARTAKWRHKNTILAPREGNGRQDRGIRQTGVAAQVDAGVAAYRYDNGWSHLNRHYQLRLIADLIDEHDLVVDQRLRHAVAAGIRDTRAPRSREFADRLADEDAVWAEYRAELLRKHREERIDD
jgi:hypothetical protein